LAGIRISPAEEARFGQQIVEQFFTTLRQQGIQVSQKGRDASYLQALVAELRRHMQNADRYRSIKVWVADSDEPDARSVPGGWVIISRGLLEFAESEAAVAGVLAHELSHIDRGHQLELLRRLKLAQQTITSGNFQPDAWFQTGKLLASQFARPFRPEQETEADADAVNWLVASRYDPTELARLFQQMQGRDQPPNSLPSFLRTHPSPADREGAVRRQMLQLIGGNPDPLYRGRENLRRRVPRHQRRFAE
jgi:predicted Zn-dependent protease